MIISLSNPVLLFINPWTLNIWIAGKSLCLQWHFYLSVFSKAVFKISCENAQVTAHCFENPKEVLNPHVTLCTQRFQKCKAAAAAPAQMTEQLGCVWPLPRLDKLWEEESSSGDASVERRVSILSRYKDNFRLAVGDIASPLLYSFLKALSLPRTQTLQKC